MHQPFNYNVQQSDGTALYLLLQCSRMCITCELLVPVSKCDAEASPAFRHLFVPAACWLVSE